MTSRSEQRIHGKSTWTTKCPIFHKCFAFKQGTSQIESLHRYTHKKSIRAAEAKPLKNVIAADQAQFKLWKPAQSLKTWKHMSSILSVVIQLYPEPAQRSERDWSLAPVERLWRHLLPCSMIRVSSHKNSLTPSILCSSCLSVTPPSRFRSPLTARDKA